MSETTYKGWPLYFYAGDANPGDTNGDNFEVWYVIKDPFYSVVAMTKTGGPALYLADPAGRTLYIDSRDSAGSAPSCAGACLNNWPAFAAGNGSVPTGINPSRLTTFTRPDGIAQSALDGHPLYSSCETSRRATPTAEAACRAPSTSSTPAPCSRHRAMQTVLPRIMTALLLVGGIVHAAITSASQSSVLVSLRATAGLRIEGTTHELGISEREGELLFLVPLSAVDTGIGLRNRHLRTALDVVHFPEAELRVARKELVFPPPGGIH